MPIQLWKQPKKTTKIEIYRAHVLASEAAAATGHPEAAISPVIAKMEDTDDIKAAPLATLDKLIERGKNKAQKALEQARAMAAEVEKAQKRRFLLSRIDALDVCLASLTSFE